MTLFMSSYLHVLGYALMNFTSLASRLNSLLPFNEVISKIIAKTERMKGIMEMIN